MGEMNWLLSHKFSDCLKSCAAFGGCAGAGLQEAAALLYTVLREHLQQKKKSVTQVQCSEWNQNSVLKLLKLACSCAT